MTVGVLHDDGGGWCCTMTLGLLHNDKGLATRRQGKSCTMTRDWLHDDKGVVPHDDSKRLRIVLLWNRELQNHNNHNIFELKEPNKNSKSVEL